MPKIELSAVPERKGVGYPKPFDAPCAERIRQRLGATNRSDLLARLRAELTEEA